MEIILLEKIGKLGDLGDCVTVKPGYGRNYLIPQGKAVLANDANRAEYEARRAELEANAADALSAAELRAVRLGELGQITVEAKAGEEGKLFGSVGSRDIAEAVSAAGVELKKSEIRLPDGALRKLGEYEINVHLHSSVDAVVSLSVIAD
ncbi:MAG: 50S ribosomal protein L9 [Halieaceae bacterium]|nr:50S ribosomal protein L9 [Halieaceae bacterium]